VINGSNAELYMLLSEYRGEQNAGNRANLFIVVIVVRLVVVLMVMLSPHLVMVLVIFGLLIKT
jgi:hypothetical protein